MDDEEKVIDVCKKTKRKRLSADEFRAFYGKAIGYLCDKENRYAEKLLKEMEERYSSSKEISEMILLYDCQMAYDIYINHNTERISDLKELIKTEIPDEQKAVYYYRLAKLYKYAENKEETILCLKKAKENTKEKSAVTKINKILSGNWDLL